MSGENRSSELHPADNLDGYTIEELSAYLDAGRFPRDPIIESSPGCQRALESLTRLQSFTASALEESARAESEVDESWLESIITAIVSEARVGRRIPIENTDPGFDLGMYEGALRALLRGAEESVPGVIVGRCRIDGAVEQPNAETKVHVDISVAYGMPIEQLTNALRKEMRARLQQHTTLRVVSIDVSVTDILPDSFKSKGAIDE